MKVSVLKRWKDPESFQIEDIEKPSPGKDEILIKIAAASVTAGDCEFRNLKLPLGLSIPMRLYAGWNRPERLKVFGQEFAGTVEEVGETVEKFKAGDEVFGTTGMGFGAYAQYIVKTSEPKDTDGVITLKPSNLSFNEAAVIPTAGMEAIHYLEKAALKPGDKVLIIGAGGSIGSLTIQLAKYKGLHVSVVDKCEKLDYLKKLGADRVIDHKSNNYSFNSEKYDLIIDIVGKKTVNKGIKSLKKGGSYFMAFVQFHHLWLFLFYRIFHNKRIALVASTQSKDELIKLKNLIELNVIKPVLDRSYTLEEVSKAHKYADSGLKVGNIGISIK